MGNISDLFGQPYKPRKQTLAASPESQLIDDMQRAGINPPRFIVMDGQIHRFKSGTKGQGKGGDRPGWYIIFGDGVPAGRYGCWRAGIEATWRADTGRDITPAEEMMHAKRMAEAKKIRDAEQERKREVAEDQVSIIYNKAQPASEKHPYLVKKGIAPHGARVTGDGRLVTPLFDEKGVLSSLQYIDSNGGKLYHSGGQTKGKFWQIGDIKEIIYIAEGFATAATIHETTGDACIVAYSASNIVLVADTIKKLHDKQIVIVADNDESGVGQKYAEQASAKTGASIIIPPEKGDANDYKQSGGDLYLLLNPPIDDWLVPADEFCSQPAPIKWMIKGWLQQDSLMMVHGPSGGGKTFVVLDWCLHIASSKSSWAGNTVRNGNVVYLAGEGHHGLRGRVAAWKERHQPESMKLWLSKSGCDLNTPSGYQKVVDQVRALKEPPVLIVVDTLHRFLNGDENRADDAKTMLDACSSLIETFNCAVLLVHHTGVSDEAQHRARGSSAWRGALDIEISVIPSKAEQPITIQQRKSKDSEMVEPVYVDLSKVELPGWIDEDGEQVTSACIEVADKPVQDKKTSKIEAHRQLFTRAWEHTGGQIIDNKAYLIRSDFIEFLVQKHDMRESSAKVYVKPSAKGKPIFELILAEIIKPMADGWIVTDKVMNSALMISRNTKG